MGRVADKRKKKYKKLNLCEIIDGGHSLAVMGNMLGGLTRERARQILHEEDLYNRWVNARTVSIHKQKEDYTRLREGLPELLDALRIRESQLLKKMSWPERKAYEHLSSAGRTDKRMNYGRLVKLFSKYEESVSIGRRTTLSEFSSYCGLFYTTVASVIRRGGLKTLNRPNREKKSFISHHSRLLISRCKNAHMPCTDLGYFIGAKFYLIGERTKGEKIPVKKLTARFNWELKYRTAFEIYEARDAGFEKHEIPELLNLHMPAVDYALQNQNEITETIRHDIKLLYKDKIPEKYLFLFSI